MSTHKNRGRHDERRTQPNHNSTDTFYLCLCKICVQGGDAFSRLMLIRYQRAERAERAQREREREKERKRERERERERYREGNQPSPILIPPAVTHRNQVAISTQHVLSCTTVSWGTRRQVFKVRVHWCTCAGVESHGWSLYTTWDWSSGVSMSHTAWIQHETRLVLGIWPMFGAGSVHVHSRTEQCWLAQRRRGSGRCTDIQAHACPHGHIRTDMRTLARRPAH